MTEDNSATEPKQSGDTKTEPKSVPPTPPPPPVVELPGTPVPMPPNSDKWLWVDPYLTEEKLKKRPIVGSVLLADDIINYISNYNVLVDKEDFELGKEVFAKLKGASYTLTPDENGAWIYMPSESDGGDAQKTITATRDDAGDYYLVPKNSLVYIKIKQKLRIPFYIIGRHNLKIRYVYQGLLLGTGPQVDPGFCGNLIIPLHNFTTRDVKIYIKQSFISIDFTRTTELTFGDKKVPETIEELYSVFGSAKHLIERSKVSERNSISKYLEGASPRSQMGQFQYDFESLEAKVKAEFEKIEATKKQLVWERLAVIFSLVTFLIASGSFIYASLNYYRGFVADFKTETERVKNIAAAVNVTSLDNKILLLESNQSVALTVVSNQISEAILKVQNIQDEEKAKQQSIQSQIDGIQHALNQLQINVTNKDKNAADLKSP